VRRRGFLAALGGFAAFVSVRPAAAQVPIENGMNAVLRDLTQGAAVQEGRMTLQVPRLADNGASVPLKVTVQSPMSASDRVKSISLLSPRNPRPLMATFHFGEEAPRAEVSTRVRLNGTQRVLAIAQLSDGTFWSATAQVEVTESACLDAS
jgi:sulfur-oxidizing protein SoxY